MSTQQLAEEIETLIESTMEVFSIEVEAIQGRLYNRLLSVLKELELDDDGYIKQSSVNRRVLLDAENLINEYIPGESLTAAVSRAVGVIVDLDSFNSKYFSELSPSFNPNRNYFKSLQNKTIKNIESTLLQDGLTAQIKNPLVDILNQNINTGGKFSGFLHQVRNYIEGEENEGKLYSYSRTYLSDALFNYSRAFQQAITADLKLTWYSYSGGSMDKTRDFCLERAGNFYHQSEIEKWANQDWQGKNPATTESSIFIYCGGYNCRHSLIPVSKLIVPKEDLARVPE